MEAKLYLYLAVIVFPERPGDVPVQEGQVVGQGGQGLGETGGGALAGRRWLVM